MNNLGLVKYETGDVRGAIDQWRAAIASKEVEPQLALAVAQYAKGDREQGLKLAEAAIRLDKRWANVQFLKKELWGNRLLTDTQYLLKTPRMQAFLSEI